MDFNTNIYVPNLETFNAPDEIFIGGIFSAIFNHIATVIAAALPEKGYISEIRGAFKGLLSAKTDCTFLWNEYLLLRRLHF